MVLIKHSFGFTLISEILSDVLQLWNYLQIYLCLMGWKELKWPSQNNEILIFALLQLSNITSTQKEIDWKHFSKGMIQNL